MKQTLLAALFALAACGGDNGKTPDAPQPPPDSMPDAMMPVTFTSYVIDLVKNHTDNGPSRDYSEFMSLPDPDQNNDAAYASLF